MVAGLHSNATGVDLHEDKRFKVPVRAASTANVSLTTPGAAMDGVTLATNDRILLKDQSTGAQNGLYVWAGASTTLVRTADATVAADFVFGFLAYVREGTANGGKTWQYTTSTTPVVVGTTAITFVQMGNASSGTVTSVALTLPGDLSVTGSPVTGSGTLAVSRAVQNANKFLAGPASGANATPGYRFLVPADYPGFVASGASHAAGAVPDPGSTAGLVRFLREDGWARVFNSSASAPVLGSGGTITTSGVTEARVAPAGLVTGVIMQSGTYGGQECWVTNESALANIIVMAAAGTSKVADGIACVIAGGFSMLLVWDDVTTLWYHRPGPMQPPLASATAVATATSGTITTSGVTVSRVNPAGAITAVVLQAGLVDTWEVTVQNQAAAANTVTFAASGTSNVADGVSDVIAGVTSRRFQWSSATSLWYPLK